MLIYYALRDFFRWLYQTLFGSSWAAAGWNYTACPGKGPPTRRSTAGSGTPSFLCINNQSHVSTFPLHQAVFAGRNWFWGLTQEGGSLSANHWHHTGTYWRPSGVETLEPALVPEAVVPLAPLAPGGIDLPSVHPLLNPLGAPRTLPGAQPYRKPGAAASPYDMPGQARQGGYAPPFRVGARPWYRGPELVPEVALAWPYELAVGRLARAPRRKPPRKGEKEGKTAAAKAVGRIAAGAFAVTEASDLIESILDAMPKRHQMDADGPQTLPAKIRHLWENWHHVDPAQAVANVIWNHYEDKAVGWANRKSEAALKKMGATSVRIPN